MVRRLAGWQRNTLTATIRKAREHEYEHAYGGESDFVKAVRPTQEAFGNVRKPPGFKADNAF